MRPDMYARFARPRDDDDYEDLPRRPKKKQGMSTGTILLIIFGSIGAVACIVCVGVGGVLVYGAMKVKEVADDVQQQMQAGLLPEGQGKVLLSQQGRLVPNDPLREGWPHKEFKVQLEQGKTYVISLSSKEMDSHLFLYDPGGLRVADDDDSGGPNHLDSRIHYTAGKTGNYTVSASVHGGQQGFFRGGGATFTLTVRER
jgi:hypothetical protein